MSMRLSGRGLRALLAVVAAAVMIGAGPGVGGAAVPGCADRAGAQPGRLGSGSELHGGAAVSACRARAVGGNSAVTPQTLIERWNGSSWKKVSSPSPGSIVNVLSGVAATSASNAWAVGSFVKGTAFQTLIERWNGTTWTQAPSPNPAGATRDNQLTSVAATSASNAWAVGSYVSGAASALTQTLVLRWNGTRWTQVPSPSPGGTANPDRLAGVAATSASNAWAVGSYTTGSGFRTLTLHWNGTTWKQVPSPNSGTASDANTLSGVAAIAASDAWAVGSYTTGSGFRTLTLHWNGTTWKKVPSPNAGSGKNGLLAVAATSASNAWAVGYFAGRTANRALIEHWDGKSWTLVPSPGSSNHLLSGVAATSASNAWAVGSVVERWNGKTWAMASIPNPGSNGNNLSAVTATSASNAWAVGSS